MLAAGVYRCPITERDPVGDLGYLDVKHSGDAAGLTLFVKDPVTRLKILQPNESGTFTRTSPGNWNIFKYVDHFPVPASRECQAHEPRTVRWDLLWSSDPPPLTPQDLIDDVLRLLSQPRLTVLSWQKGHSILER
jgi:hypothetical protein